jgi:hypothetical protein
VLKTKGEKREPSFPPNIFFEGKRDREVFLRQSEGEKKRIGEGGKEDRGGRMRDKI